MDRCPECGGVQYQNEQGEVWCVRCLRRSVPTRVCTDEERMRDALEEIARIGTANPGYGHTCALIAKEALEPRRMIDRVRHGEQS